MTSEDESERKNCKNSRVCLSAWPAAPPGYAIRRHRRAGISSRGRIAAPTKSGQAAHDHGGIEDRGVDMHWHALDKGPRQERSR